MATLDQMQTFMAVVREGSFSAAAKRDARTQSSVTYAIQTMESDLGVVLFDRTGYRPVLTEAGRQLLPRISRMVRDAADLTAQAHGMSRGLEAQIGIVVDAIYPMDRLFDVLAAFKTGFPTVPVRLSVEALGGAFEMVRSGAAAVGIVAHVPEEHVAAVERRPLRDIALTVVAAPDHPLAGSGTPLSAADLGGHLQLVLGDRTSLTDNRNFGVIAPRTWQIGDLGAKQALLRAGLGWGGMPRHMVADDLAAGRLVELALAHGGDHSSINAMLVWSKANKPGPAARWLVETIAAAKST